MNKKALLACCTILLLIPLCTVKANAQILPKFEVAGQMALLNTGQNDFGFGGRFGYSPISLVTLETEIDHFPQNRYGQGTKTLALFGAKLGARTDSIGFFTKFRPGFITMSDEYTGSSDCLNNLTYAACFAGQKHFAMDFGGGFELFPSKHTIIRFDIGNLLIRDNGTTSSNYLMNVGIGFRF